jgi:hydroxypyruvate reductase
LTDNVKPILMAMLPIYGPAMAALEQDYEVLKPWEAADPVAFIRERGGAVRAVVTTTSRGFPANEFDAFPRLEALACFGPYVTLLDLPRAHLRGVAVTNTPDDTAQSVADLALALVLASMRRLCEADRFVRSGQWPVQAFASGREVHGKRCGVIGFGRIGQQVAQRAEAFGMRVSYHGPRRKDGVAYPYVATLEDLALDSDCLVVTCALTPETRGMVNASVLDALGPDGFLVNVARGAIVDESALIAALAAGRIAGAGLDVFVDEPQVPAELLAMEQVVLAPHIGTSTRENRDERTRKLVANLRAHFAGERPPYAVATDV